MLSRGLTVTVICGRKVLLAAEVATEGKRTAEQKAEHEAVDFLGTTSEEIDAAMTRLRAEADAIVCNNPGVMEDYQCAPLRNSPRPPGRVPAQTL